MTKYLFNSNIYGYELANVTNFSNELTKDDLLIMIIDESCMANSGEYYKLVDKALREQCRVILIGIDDGNEMFSAIASNMLIFKNYGIYKVDNKDDISAEFLIKIQDRNPDIEEAQAYLDNEIIAYQDMCTLLYGIESLVNEGNMEGLKNHVERHLASIEGLVSTINRMKKTCDCFNSNELIDNINELKGKIDELNKNIEEQNNVIEEVKHNRDEFKVETENLKRELTKAKAEGGSNSGDNSGQNVIKTYTAFNTTIHANNRAFVIYFKEISYVRFTNTLISILHERIEKMKLNCKLLIYDNNKSMLANYGLDVITGDNYANNKNLILKTKKKVVVAEPFQTIIQDVVTSKDAADVVIIYDSLGFYEDIIKGNNVTKFFVINSASDVRNTVKIKTLGADDTSYIITTEKNSYKPDDNKPVQFLDIPNVADNFSSLSDSAKFQKYNRAVTTRTGVNLLDAILKKSHIEALQ